MIRVLVVLSALFPAADWAGEIRLTVVEPKQISRRNWPVTSGVPLAQGAVRDARQAALYNSQGNELPLQTEALARWPDGSIRWLLLDFTIDLQPGETAQRILRYGDAVSRTQTTDPLPVVQNEQQVELFTGPLKIVIPKRGFRLLDRVWLDRNTDGRFSDDERITVSGGAGVELSALTKESDVRVYRADDTTCEVLVEQAGPLRACLRIERDHANASGKMFRYVVRLHAFRGQSFVRMDYTFINDHKPQWLSKIKSLDLVFAMAGGITRPWSILEGNRTESCRLFQVDDQRFEVNGTPGGNRARGWAAVGDERGGLAVGVRTFWQNWPKSLSVEDVAAWNNDEPKATSHLRVGVCLAFSEGLYDGKPIREEAKLYYYLSSCIHNRHNPPPEISSVTFLASEALAYESEMTGNHKHRRILRAAMRTGINAGFRSVAAREQQGQTGYASMLFRFTPYALHALDEEIPSKKKDADPPVTDLFTSGKSGYHTYRIPAIVTTKSGVLLAICEGRKTSRADHGDVDLVLRRSIDGGRSWGPIQLIYEEGGDKKITIGNPCPVVDRETGVVWLPFTRDNDDVLLVSSNDDGQSWSKPRVITPNVKRDHWTWYATGPGNGIQLTFGPHKGRLVIPCDHRIRSITDRRKSTRSHVIYSDDHGRTWSIGGVTDFLMNECAVVERSDDSLLLNMRSNRGLHRRGVATSNDGGLSWSKCTDAQELIEPVCQASMIRYTSAQRGGKNRLLFCNPASQQGRNHLTVRVSYDEGRTWPKSRLLYEGSSAYSSLTVLPSGDVGVLFERDDYGKITFARLNKDWLENLAR